MLGTNIRKTQRKRAVFCRQATETALEALAVKKQIADRGTWCRVQDVIQNCVGLERDGLLQSLQVKLEQQVDKWEARKKQKDEAEKVAQVRKRRFCDAVCTYK